MCDQFAARLCVGPGVHRMRPRISRVLRFASQLSARCPRWLGECVSVLAGRSALGIPIGSRCWARVTSPLLTFACWTGRRALGLPRLSPDPTSSCCAGRMRPNTVSPLGEPTLSLTKCPPDDRAPLPPILPSPTRSMYTCCLPVCARGPSLPA